MGMIRVISLKEHEYASRRHPAGEIYEIDERYLKTLAALGKVKESPDTESPKTSTSQPKREYKRRDMKAE